MSGLPAVDALEGLLAAATGALERGDAEAAAAAVDRALAHIAAGPAPADPARLLEVHARLDDLARREAARLSTELSRLGSSRRAAGLYRSG